MILDQASFQWMDSMCGLSYQDRPVKLLTKRLCLDSTSLVKVPSSWVITNLFYGPQGDKCDNLMWSPLDFPCNDGPKGPNCDPYCLYNIVKDPEERTELSKTEPAMLKKLLDRYNSYSKEPESMQDQGYHSESAVPKETGACQYMASHGGYWRPWQMSSKEN